MIKKPQIIAILLVMGVGVFFAASSQFAGQEVSLQSKASHAEKLWETSAHSHSEDEAFVHWDEDGEISTRCAKCHSTQGYNEFITTGSVSTAVPAGPGIENNINCDACHTNSELGIVHNHTDVTFPSGVTVEELGPEALCMECHQGRESKKDVDEAIEEADVDDDTVTADLGFINIHYYVAAANQLGTVIKGGYEYDDMKYDARFAHVTGYNACITCHNPHSLQVDLFRCNTCHTGITDPKNIRYYGSFTDYDGDGDMEEGIYYEIKDLEAKLYSAIQRYARNTALMPIVYDSHTYPYFFNDLNGNGAPDTDEANYGNQYRSFTPRLLRAAYNYQVSKKDPNSFAHGGKYIIELLYDSIMDLNSKLLVPVDMTGSHRGDEGHFDGSAEAWRHWDEDEYIVPGRCARCHSADGLAYYLENGENVDTEAANGMLCTTCHTSPPSLRNSPTVTFPSGVVKDLGDSSNLCMNCHQGRESMDSVLEDINASPPPWGFINVHYYPTAAVFYGSEVRGGFQFQGKTYAGQKMFPNHMGLFDTCVECHMGTSSPHKPYDVTGKTHNVYKPNQEDCVYCHGQDVSQPNPGSDPAKFKFSGIRPATTPDYDGDGDEKEALKYEIKGLEEALYAEIQKFAADRGMPIIYDSHSYPYFFHDTNGNGAIDFLENIYPNKYNFMHARLLKAAYNYQVSKKDPHGYIHNSRYVAQLLVDSIEHLGGSVAKYTWRK
ncbi:MAG: hypothetical protein JSV17_00865 [Candidatus Aminicenantes bacterium]|nr:MAG: hypothetical protein JSV17_00865 [Candidatus Aminicenantes bacterium]